MNPTPTAIQEYDRDALAPDETETATFALGCFWGPDAQFGAMEGVVRTRVGYAGGTKVDPTYHALGDHTESFQVDYDPAVVSFRDLLDVVFESHKPHHQTAKTQYQDVVFYANDDQKRTIDSFLDDRGLDADAIETRVERLSRFYLAEDYHQKYNLKAKASLKTHLEEAGYGEEDFRESPAAAKMNGYAAGRNLPENDELGTLLNRRPFA